MHLLAKSMRDWRPSLGVHAPRWRASRGTLAMRTADAFPLVVHEILELEETVVAVAVDPAGQDFTATSEADPTVRVVAKGMNDAIIGAYEQMCALVFFAGEIRAMELSSNPAALDHENLLLPTPAARSSRRCGSASTPAMSRRSSPLTG